MRNYWKRLFRTINCRKAFIKNGWNLFKPILENGKVDLIAEKDNKYIKIQIKTVQTEKNSKLIPVRKISHNMGEYKIKHYTKNDIDYFIGVDLETEDLYILLLNFLLNIKVLSDFQVVKLIKIILFKWSLIMETLLVNTMITLNP